MGSAAEDRAEARSLPEGDVIRILLEQHARIRELFAQVRTTTGERRKEVFDQLRALLAVHETAEEMILRPVSSSVAGQDVVDARNEEESEANAVLAQLEDLDVDSIDFDKLLVQFEASVIEHAESEEHEEFPAVLAQCDEEQRATMGRRLQAAEKLAPTHPHPTAAGSTTAQWTLGPFASLIDRTKDAIAKVG